MGVGGAENPEFLTKSILSAVVVWWNKMCQGPCEIWCSCLTKTLHFVFQAS